MNVFKLNFFHTYQLLKALNSEARIVSISVIGSRDVLGSSKTNLFSVTKCVFYPIMNTKNGLYDPKIGYYFSALGMKGLRDKNSS
jgi:hypothetical protein